jgi:FtsP/CotA-like multicopper oxidase with cupredoxin domain
MLSMRILFAVTGVLVLAALWLAFRPAPLVKQAEMPVAIAPAEKSFDIVVKDGKLASAPESMRVRVGEQVTLRVHSNANDELHVHGYDLKLRIKAGEPAALQFSATRSGRFELELHRRHTPAGALEVYPQ